MELDEAWLAPVHDLDRIAIINAELRQLIGDDERPQASSQNGSSKQSLREMLAQALARTGGVPVKRIEEGVCGLAEEPREAMGSRSSDPDCPPSAYQVAMAIVAAAREMGADPIDVASGVTTHGGRFANHSVPRSRAYAAFAIRQVFPHNGNTAISRWVGARNPNSYMSLIESQRRGGQIRWWDEGIFKRVVLRLRTTPREAA